MTHEFDRLLAREPGVGSITERMRSDEEAYRANLAALARDPAIQPQLARFRREFQELSALGAELKDKYADEIRAYRANPREYVRRVTREARPGMALLNDGENQILMERADAVRFVQIDRSVLTHHTAIIERVQLRLTEMGITDPNEVARYVHDFRQEHMFAPPSRRQHHRSLERFLEIPPANASPQPREIPTPSDRDEIAIVPPLPTPILSGRVRQI